MRIYRTNYFYSCDSSAVGKLKIECKFRRVIRDTNVRCSILPPSTFWQSIFEILAALESQELKKLFLYTYLFMISCACCIPDLHEWSPSAFAMQTMRLYILDPPIHELYFFPPLFFLELKLLFSAFLAFLAFNFLHAKNRSPRLYSLTLIFALSAARPIYQFECLY